MRELIDPALSTLEQWSVMLWRENLLSSKKKKKKKKKKNSI
jgi:hypothetical protein